MKAMAIKAFGGSEQFAEVEIPTPQPGKEELLIKVHAAALNPVDTKIRAGYLGREETFPMVLGFDVSGTIEAVGEHVRGFTVGQEVYGSPSLAGPGSNAEFVCLDYRSAALKPASLSHEQAAALPLVTITAWEGLYDRCQLPNRATVLIHAGAGGVGHVALQLARARDCRIITTASRDDSIEFCKSLGAHVVINYTQEDFVERVNAETQGNGCEVVFDTVGGETFGKSLDCVSLDGQVVTIVRNEYPDVVPKLFMKNATLHAEFMGVPGMFNKDRQRQGRILRHAGAMIDEARLTPTIAETMPMTDVARAHDQQAAGHVIGKQVLTNCWS